MRSQVRGTGLRRARVCKAAAALVAVAALTTPGQAAAGTYEVVLCTNPAGGAGAGVDGWQQDPQSPWSASASCGDGGSGLRIFNSPGDPYALRDLNATQTWSVPAGIRIQRVDLFRSAAADRQSFSHAQNGVATLSTGEGQQLERVDYSTLGRRIGSSDERYGAGNRVIFEGLDTSAIVARVECPNPCSTDDRQPPAIPGDAISYHLYGGTATLSESQAPSASAPRVSEGDSRIVAFGADDRGGGLKEATLEVDGATVRTQSLGDNNGACVEPYRQRVPCPLAAASTFALSGVPDGTHSVRVRVRDIAGNEAVSPEATITVDDGRATGQTGGGPGSTTTTGTGLSGPGTGSGTTGTSGASTSSALPAGANGVGASRGALLKIDVAGRDVSSVQAGFGRRLTVSGRLLNDRAEPISGAVLHVLARERTATASAREIDLVRTGNDGRFEYEVGPGASRAITFGYRAFGEDPEFAAERSLELRVRAGIALRVGPRRVRNGRAVRFSGRLLGGPVPARGKLVDLEVRVGNRWRPFAVVRTNRRGGFTHRYRFRRTFRATAYRFRARSREQQDYPYAEGYSRVTRVKVRPR